MRILIGKIDDTRVFRHYNSAIDHHVQLSTKHLINLLRVIIEALIGFGDAGGDDRTAQFFHQGKGNSIVRNPYPHGLLVRQHNLGDQFGGLQDKGVRSGYKCLHGSVSIIGNIGVLTDIFQVCADDAQSFVLGEPFQTVDPFHGIFLVEIAAEAVDGIGGIGNDPSLPESIYDLADEPRLRIIRVDLDDHVLFSLYSMNCVFEFFMALFDPHHRLGNVERVVTYLFKVGEHVDEDKAGINLADPIIEPLYVALSHGVFKMVDPLLIDIRFRLDATVSFLYPIDY